MKSEEIIVISQNDNSETDHVSQQFVFFIIIGVLMAACIRQVHKRIKIPYLPMLLLLGIMIGYFKFNLGSIVSSTLMRSSFNPRIILLIFLPALLFLPSFNCEWYTFRKFLVSILTLSVPGVVLGAVLMAICFNMALFDPENQLSWYQILTLTFALSVIDNESIINLLKELGAHTRYNTLIQGELLINNGVAMLFFVLFLNLITNNNVTLTSTIITFIRLSIGGVVVGIIFGMVISYWIRRIVRDDVLGVMVVVSGTYLCFFLTEFTFIQVSGIWSVISLGLYISSVAKRKIYPQSKEALHVVWSFIKYNCEAILFIVNGIIFGTFMIIQSTITFWDWVRMVIFWIFTIIIRTIIILIFYPLLKKTGYTVTKKQLVVLAYGGLRGALGMCLSLIVCFDQNLSQRFRQLIVFYMCGITFLTIVVNGLTYKKVINYVQPIAIPQIKTKLLTKCSKQVLKSAQQKLKQLKVDPKVGYTQWKDVERLTRIKNINTAHQINQIILGDNLNQVQKLQIVDQIRFRFIRYLHKIYLSMFQYGNISENSAVVLLSTCDVINDKNANRFNYFQLLSSNFLMGTNKYYMKFKDTPIIGPVCIRFLINKIYDAYQMSTTFIEACEEAIYAFKHSLPQSNQTLNYLIHEVKDDIQLATNFVLQLQNNYPTVMKAAHTSKVSVMILKHKKHKLEQMYNEGFVDSSDNIQLKKQIDTNIIQIQNHTFQLTDIKFNQVLTDCPLFSDLPTHEIVTIRMKSNQRLFAKGTTIQIKNKQVKFVFFIITGTIKQQFQNFYFMKNIGTVVNPHDFIYNQPSRAAAKTLTNSRVMQIQGKVIMQLLDKYPQFKKKWYKCVFPYSLKFSKASQLIDQQLNEHLQRRFIEKSVVVFLKAGQKTTVEFGAYIFEGQINSMDSQEGTLIRDNFFFQKKIIIAKTDAKMLLFQPIYQVKNQNKSILSISGVVQN